MMGHGMPTTPLHDEDPGLGGYVTTVQMDSPVYSESYDSPYNAPHNPLTGNNSPTQVTGNIA